jgi:uncharacterized protein YqgV (UPF0045/DUF77 family)
MRETEGALPTLPGERLGAAACQFSVYPLRRPRIGATIERAIRAAGAGGAEVRVQNLSTVIYGDEEQVFAGLRAAFRAAQAEGPAVVVATLTAGMPTDDEVARIQRSSATSERRSGE